MRIFLAICAILMFWDWTVFAAPARTRVLFKNDEAMAARWSLLNSATKDVYVQSYIVAPDAIGLAILGKLRQLAIKGVKVKFMFDARGSWLLTMRGSKYLRALVAAGVEVVEFNPLALEKLHNNFGANHDKLFVVDGILSILGGRNVSDKDLTETAKSNFDMDVLVESKELAEALIEAFETEKNLEINGEYTQPKNNQEQIAAVRELEKARMEYEKSAVNMRSNLTDFFSGSHHVESSVLVTKSRFHQAGNPFREKFFELIRNAKREIILQNAYVILTDEAVHELRTAADRGVRIILQTNSMASKSSSGIPEANFENYWEYLSEAIPRIEIYTTREVGRHLHTKAFVFDSSIAIVGSYNLDNLSDHINGETALLIEDQDVASRIRNKIMGDDLNNSVFHTRIGKITFSPYNVSDRVTCFSFGGLWARFLGKIAYYLRPVL